ncbi:reverse transcriptase-like protein [Paracidovorax sp. MALMAid1276]|uniref:reverse transcriptase-like protein n=1 Tax=Paracidovorax sp. MALMAid1276 TaxID=3411631 RepID=UPI003B9BA697
MTGRGAPPADAAITGAPAPWVIHCDGSAVPNPGRMGLGAVLTGPDGVVRHQISQATHFTGCNNEAELRALLAALQWLTAAPPEAEATPARLRVVSDSSLLVQQLGPQPGAPIVRLAPLVDAVRSALQPFAGVELVWVPRHRNTQADALARAALGLAPKASARPPSKNHKSKAKRM